MNLLIATSNKGKFIEISEPLEDLTIDLFSLQDIPTVSSPKESGLTCQENAIIKAKYYREIAGFPTLCDDSGIVIEALGDELGIHTRRWGAGEDATDEEWIAFFLNRMSSESNKKATFLCHLAYIDESDEIHLFDGTCSGYITEGLEAPYLPGLPISACFKPDGYHCVFSALKPEQKNNTSHRGRAVKKFREQLMCSFK
jgi:XTP/dITP diphosphohydrolase